MKLKLTILSGLIASLAFGQTATVTVNQTTGQAQPSVGNFPVVNFGNPGANTLFDGITLFNSTASTSGNQQFSPSIHFRGRGFALNTADEQVDWRVSVKPTQLASQRSSRVSFDNSMNGGAYTAVWELGYKVGDAPFINSPVGGFRFQSGGSDVFTTRLANNNAIGILSGYTIAWGADPINTNWDTGIARNSAGVLEVNNGNPGTLATATGTVFNATTGFRVANTAPANYELTGNGTNFVGKASDVPNGSGAQQTGFTADQYLTGSAITVNAGDFTVGTSYRCIFDMAKTGGTATPIVTIRVGTAGTTADAAVQTITWAAGTNVADTGMFEVMVNFRAVGASATVASYGRCSHNLASTGLTSTGAAGNGTISNSTSSTFNSTAATKIGISFNGGASFGGTNNVVQTFLNQP